MKRKNLKGKKASSNSESNLSLSSFQKRHERLLRSEDAEGRKYRETRDFNTSVLLMEIKDFS